VSIRVLPDSSRFREDLKLSLERIEKTMKATIPAHLEVTRESVRRLRQQLRDLQVRIKVEPYITQEQMQDIKNELEDIDPRINLDLNALNAQRRLAFISRDRSVSLFVKVNQASVAAAASTLAALSGTRLVGNLFDNFFKNIADLDKNAPKIGLIATGITTLVGIAGAGISNILGLAGSLAQLAQASIFLPSFFIAGGVAIGVAVAALKDMKTVLADLAPGFHLLQDNISRGFWEQAAEPIREMVRALLPSLNEQLTNTGQALGGMFADLSNSIRENVTPEYLDTVFDRMNQGLNRARRGIAPFIHALTTLGGFGSEYFNRAGEAIANLATRFDNFITKAHKSGELKEWAEEGIQAFKDLGRVFANTFRVFAALNRAAQSAGGSTFAGLADGLGRLAETLNKPVFQTTFATIFAGAHAAMDGLIDGLGELGHGLASFAPTMAITFKEVGLILEGIGRALRRLFENPTLQQGIQDFFSGFKSFVDQLAPAMDPLGLIIGTLATAMGSLLAQAAPVINEVLNVLAPLFEEIWKAIQPLIPDLTSLATLIVKELGPPLLTLAREVLPELIPIIADLIPVIAELVKAASPVIVEFFKNLGKALETAGPYISSAAAWFTDLADALNKFPLAMFQFFAGADKLDFFKTMFSIAIDHPEIPAFFNTLNTALGGLFDKIGGAATAISNMNAFAEIVQRLVGAAGIQALTTAIETFLLLGPLWDIFWSNMVTAVNTFIAELPVPLRVGLAGASLLFTTFQTTRKVQWDGFWRSLPGVVTTYLTLSRSNVGGGMSAIAVMLATHFSIQQTNWSRHWAQVALGAALGIRAINSNVGISLPQVLVTLAGFFINATAGWNAGWAVLSSMVTIWFGRIKANVDIGAAIAITAIRSMAGSMVIGLYNFVGQFFSAGASLITSFVQGIASGQNLAVSAAIAVVKAALDVLPRSPAKKGPLSGIGWTNLRKSGTAVTRQWASGIDYDMQPVQNATANVVSAATFKHGGLSTASVRSAGGTVDSTHDRALVNIEGDYYGATPEKVANEFDRKLRRGSLVAQMGKIGIG
jgi:hypothetical protein